MKNSVRQIGVEFEEGEALGCREEALGAEKRKERGKRRGEQVGVLSDNWRGKAISSL